VNILDRIFKLKDNQTSVRTELVGGVTTFMTMSYIIFLQPAILSSTGMDPGAVMVATCISAALATLLMGFIAKYPIALAPGMGLNVFFAITVCGTSRLVRSLFQDLFFLSSRPLRCGVVLSNLYLTH